MNPDEVTITLPKDCVNAFLIAATNYINRIKHLEKSNRINEYRLRRIKNTNIYDLEIGMQILNKSIGDSYNGKHK